MSDGQWLQFEKFPRKLGQLSNQNIQTLQNYFPLLQLWHIPWIKLWLWLESWCAPRWGDRSLAITVKITVSTRSNQDLLQLGKDLGQKPGIDIWKPSLWYRENFFDSNTHQVANTYCSHLSSTTTIKKSCFKFLRNRLEADIDKLHLNLAVSSWNKNITFTAPTAPFKVQNFTIYVLSFKL